MSLTAAVSNSFNIDSTSIQRVSTRLKGEGVGKQTASTSIQRVSTRLKGGGVRKQTVSTSIQHVSTRLKGEGVGKQTVSTSIQRVSTRLKGGGVGKQTVSTSIQLRFNVSKLFQHRCSTKSNWCFSKCWSFLAAGAFTPLLSVSLENGCKPSIWANYSVTGWVRKVLKWK